jgi:hypothetical protein
MAKGKGQTATYKTLHGKLEIEQHETTENRCSGKVCSSFSTSGTRPVTLVTNPVMNEWMMDEVLNEERTAECLWQVEHIRGHWRTIPNPRTKVSRHPTKTGVSSDS